MVGTLDMNETLLDIVRNNGDGCQKCYSRLAWPQHVDIHQIYSYCEDTRYIGFQTIVRMPNRDTTSNRDHP